MYAYSGVVRKFSVCKMSPDGDRKLTIHILSSPEK